MLRFDDVLTHQLDSEIILAVLALVNDGIGGVLILDDDHTDILDESYEFAGWYRDPQYRQPFDADAYVLNEDLASPYDKTTDMTASIESGASLDWLEVAKNG